MVSGGTALAGRWAVNERATTDSTVASGPLARRLGVGDALVIGLGAMIGAGVFAAFGPAARAAGSGLLVGVDA